MFPMTGISLTAQLPGFSISPGTSCYPITADTRAATESKQDWQEQKKLAAKRRKIEQEYEKTEQQIPSLEEEIARLDEEFSRPEHACDAGKLAELSRMREEKETVLTDAMDRWEQRAEELEQF